MYIKEFDEAFFDELMNEFQYVCIDKLSHLRNEEHYLYYQGEESFNSYVKLIEAFIDSGFVFFMLGQTSMAVGFLHEAKLYSVVLDKTDHTLDYHKFDKAITSCVDAGDDLMQTIKFLCI